MNKELISELRKKAKVDPKEIVKALADTNDGKVVEHWLDQFAELIVRECTRIIANQAWESRTAGANGDWTEYNILSRVAGQIKEHFGVEE